MNWFADKKILVPIDFSDQSIGAVDSALEMVDDPSHIHVIHVLPDSTAIIESGVALVGDFPDDKRRQDTIHAMEEQFADEKYQGFTFDVKFGDPGSRIAAYAADTAAELVILPSHGRTGLKHLLLGSVAERVCRLSHCPVMVLKT